MSDGHSQHHQTSLLLKSFAFPSLNSNGVHVRGLDRRTIPDIGLAQVDLGARLTVEGVLDLSKDLCNATRIAQDADVVEISEEHLALTQLHPLVRELRADPEHTRLAFGGCSPLSA